MSKKRLGRGLDALLSERSTPAPGSPGEQSQPDAQTQSRLVEPEAGIASDQAGSSLDISAITPSPYQPRQYFSDEALDELAQSIKTQGLLQPVVVRPKPQGGYELIAGERRWRAAQRAGLTRIDVVVRTVTDRDASAFALIENMQRENLNAMEEAVGLARLRDEFELTQQQIADAVGKSRVAIANLLRLLNLGSQSRTLLENGDIEMGHARALLALDGVAQDQAARQIVDQGMSVRQAEAYIRKLVSGKDRPASRPAPTVDADTRRLAQALTDKLGAPVVIKHGAGGKGELVIRYSSLDELDGVLKHLGVPGQ